MNNVTSHLKECERQQMKPTVSRRKKIKILREELNEREQTIENNSANSCCFEKSNKIDNPTANSLREKRRGINKQNQK